MSFYWRASLFLFTLVSIGPIKGQVNQPSNNGDTDGNVVGSSYFFYQHQRYPRDCEEVNICSFTNSSGVHLIKPDGYPDAFEVYCDKTRDGRSWTVFYRRTGGSIKHNRIWREYKNGFGFLSNEFWLGLEKLSFLTNQKKYDIRIDIENANGSSFYIQYNDFRISDEFGDFRITGLGEYTGTAGSVVLFCPPNTEYGSCTCQASCENPDNIMGCKITCSEPETCTCQEGFLKKDEDCVPPSECGCYIQGEGVIPDKHSYVNDGCTSRCQCQSDVLTCDDSYECSSDAICEERDDIRQCYCNDGYTGDGQNCLRIDLATDCADIYNAGVTESGVYTISPTNWNGSAFEVYCNMTDGGGWTVFQRRVNGSEDFYRGWNSYRDGFGSPNHEMWLGNDKIFYLTNQRNYQLRIDLVYGSGRPYFAKYNLFRINDEDDKYRLVGLGSSGGTVDKDQMNFHRNKPFSTHDRDNDGWGAYNCAERAHGAWWYARHGDRSGNCASEGACDFWPTGNNSCKNCGVTNLNGDYNSVTRGTGIDWDSNSEYDCDVVYTEMKIKPI